MAKAKSNFATGELIEAAGGGVGAAMVARLIRGQLDKMADQEKAAKFEKFAPLVPVALGFAVTKFAPKFAGVGYGMIAYGAADFASSMIAGNIQNGPRFIAAPEYVTSEDFDDMNMNAPRKFISSALRQRLKNRGVSAGSSVVPVAQKRGFAQPVRAPKIVAEHFGGSDEWGNDSGDGY